MEQREWPVKSCDRCGNNVRLVRTKSGWMRYDIHSFTPHHCPNSASKKTHGNFCGPKDDPYKKGLPRRRGDDPGPRAEPAIRLPPTRYQIQKAKNKQNSMMDDSHFQRVFKWRYEVAWPVRPWVPYYEWVAENRPSKVFVVLPGKRKTQYQVDQINNIGVRVLRARDGELVPGVSSNQAKSIKSRKSPK